MRYWTVISRDEFIKFYRFGEINIIGNMLISNKEDLKELFENLPFEYEKGYLIIEIEKEFKQKFNLKTIDIFHKINIKEIKKVYILSQKSKQFYETQVIQKVKYHLFDDGSLLNVDFLTGRLMGRYCKYGEVHS